MVGKHTGEQGFTLLELLVVLFIISLTIGVAAVRFSVGTESAELNAESRKLVALMRQTRARAVSESLSLGITALTENDGYRLQPDDRDVLLPRGIQLSIVPHTGDIAFAEPGIYFYPDGSSNGGTLTLMGERNRRQLEVNWLTGEVAVAEE